MQGRPAHLRRRARVCGPAPCFVWNMTKQRTKSNKSLWVLLGGALLLRLVLALVTDGYPYDMSCFVAWGDKLAAGGPAAFYSEGYFADYPPGYLWVLGLVGAIRAALHIAYESKWTYFLLALVPSLCDCGLAWLVYRTAKRSSRGVKEHTALVLTAFTAFNPLMLFDTGVWKQIDGAFALPLVLCFVLLEQRRYLPAAVLYGVALAIKPQALLFGPVLAVCYLAAITLEKDRLRAFVRCFGGAALALLPPLLTGLPFFGVVQLIPKLIDKYTGTMSGYPYATINAFNWLAALGGNWKGQADPALFGISWQQLGCLNILLVTVGLAYFAVRSVRGGWFSPLLLAAYYGIGIFTLAHCMHERYMVPGVLLTLLVVLYWLTHAKEVTPDMTLDLALFFAIFLPFVMPKIHERYFFLADMLSILYAARYRNRRFMPLLVVGASLMSYMPILTRQRPVDERVLGLMMLATLVVVSRDILRKMRRSRAELKAEGGKAA